MDDLLLISIIVSVLVNLFLFVYLYKKKGDTLNRDGFVESSVEEGSALFTRTIEQEISKVERYEDYSFCLVALVFEEYPSALQDDIRTFVRKSDSVYTFDKKIYIIFPFLHVDSAFEEKINSKLVAHIELNHQDSKLLNVTIQECNIHESICIDKLLKDAE